MTDGFWATRWRTKPPDGFAVVVQWRFLPSHTRFDIVHDENAESAMNGLGTVHHVAMAYRNRGRTLRPAREEAIQWRLQGDGGSQTACLLKSFYFREAGGVLFDWSRRLQQVSRRGTDHGLRRGLKLPPVGKRF
jgi:hypothetical protein